MKAWGKDYDWSLEILFSLGFASQESEVESSRKITQNSPSETTTCGRWWPSFLRRRTTGLTLRNLGAAQGNLAHYCSA
jgi:hypothetical protein